MVYRASPSQLNMQLIKQTCTLLPRRRFYLTIQSHHGFPSIYFNCKAIRGSRCVLEAADVTCGRSRRGSNYHDNANYADDNQLNRLHSWAAFSIVAHRRQALRNIGTKSVHQQRGGDERRLLSYADANAELRGGQMHLRASGGVLVVLAFWTARSHVSSFCDLPAGSW